MSEGFKPITIETQEQMDGLFKDRLNRAEEKHRKELEEVKASFADYDSLKANAESAKGEIEALKGQLIEANEKVSGFDSTLAEKDKIIKGYEVESLKTKVAAEMGLTFEARSFLSGDTEDAIRESAETLKALIGKQHTAPMASHEPSGANNDNRAAYAQLANSLK